MNLRALVAAFLLIAFGVAAGGLGSRGPADAPGAPLRSAGTPVSVKVSAAASSIAQTQRLTRLEAESLGKAVEAAKLRNQLQALQARLSEERVATRAAGDELEEARTDYEERLHQAFLQRDHLAQQLRETTQ